MEVDLYFEPIFWLHCVQLQKTQNLPRTISFFAMENREPYL